MDMTGLQRRARVRKPERHAKTRGTLQVPHNPHEGIELNENQVAASDFETVERIQVDTVGKGPGGLQELPAASGISPLFCNEHKAPWRITHIAECHRA